MLGNKTKVQSIDIQRKEQFLELLRIGLWRDCKGAENNFHATAQQWAEVLHTGQRQAVSGIIFDAIETLPSGNMPPLELKLRSAAEVAAIEQKNNKLCRALAKIAKIYDQNGIDYLLLKGVAVGDCYPTPNRRTSGDIDILLDPSQCQKAHTLLFGEVANTKEFLRHETGAYDGVIVENHRALAHFRVPIYEKFEARLMTDRVRLPLETVDVLGQKVKCPSPTFHALFMVEHMGTHTTTGLGIRQICDWARLLYHHNDKIDRRLCREILEEAKLTRLANVFTLICIDMLGMDPKYALCTPTRNTQTIKDVNKVVKIIFDGGNFGKHYKANKSSTIHNNLPVVLRKPIGLMLILRNYSKYELMSPGLMRLILWHRLKNFLGC